MKKLILYLVVIIATFGVILYIKNPDLLNEVWIWVVGLFGVITGYVDRLLQSIKSWFKKEEETPSAITTTLIPATQLSGQAQQLAMNPAITFQHTESNGISNSPSSTTLSQTDETVDYPTLLTL